MGFSEAIKTCFSKYVTFSGRARRPEYWWFFLFIFLGSIAAAIIDSLIFGTGSPQEPPTQIISPLFSLATFLPLLAAGWRRMHDTGRPGWYLLLPLGVSILVMIGMTLGIFGFGQMEMAGANEAELRAAAGGLGLLSLAIAAILQLVLALVILWWLTRPTQPGTNAYGDEPRDP